MATDELAAESIGSVAPNLTCTQNAGSRDESDTLQKEVFRQEDIDEGSISGTEDEHGDGQSKHGQDVIVNELLCFMSNKMDVLHVELLTKLCSDFYSVEEINVAKRTMHDLFYSKEEERPRLRWRKGDKAKSSNVQDILNMMSSFQTGELPDFLARNLNNLPPLSMKDFDLSKLMTELETMKCEISAIKCAIGSQEEIKKDIIILRRATIERSAELAAEQTHRDLPENAEEDNADAVAAPDRQAEGRGPPSNEVTVEEPVAEPERPGSQEGRNHGNDEDVGIGQFADHPRYSEVLRRAAPSPMSSRLVGVGGSPTSRDNNNRVSEVTAVDQGDDRPELRQNAPVRSEDGWTFPRRRRRDRDRDSERDQVVRGNGRNLVVRAAQGRPNDRAYGRGERKCVGIFVSRLSPTTTCDVLSAHIRHELRLNNRVLVEAIKTKYSGYTSFLVRAPPEIRDKLMAPNMWPFGAIVRGYYEIERRQ